MWRSTLASALVLVALAGTRMASAGPVPRPLDVGEHERLLVVAPHPDDETLGAGGLIQRVVARGGTVRVVLVTAGDGYVEGVVRETGRPRPRPASYVAYGERRIGETRAALRVLAAHHAARLQLLGFPDGDLARLLDAHWARHHPEQSPFTATDHPPYAEAVDPGLAYDGADLLRELRALLGEAPPTLIAFPDPLDHHPDHRATALFVLLALADTARAGATPRLLAYLVHWPGWPPGWDARVPLPPKAGPAQLVLPPGLPDRGLSRTALVLSDAEVAAKRTALARHVTQQEDMAPFLATFVCRTEPFTVFTPAEVARVDALIERRP
jgi:LmbE family N-acetylglucosaminyl deacetylase